MIKPNERNRTGFRMIFRRTRAVIFIAIIALLSCAAIGLTAAAVFLARIDAAWIAGELNRSVLADKRRVLKIDGGLTVSLRLALSLELRQIALSAQDSEAAFASLDRLRFSLQWWPLLSRRLVVDKLELDGLSVAGERDAQGRYNFADLLESRSGGKWTFDIASLQLTQGRLLWRDPAHAQGITLDEISLSSGRIANDGTPSDGRLALAARLRSPAAPQADVQLHASMQYTLDPAGAQYGADDLTLRLTGRLAAQPDVDIGLTARRLMVESKPSGFSGRLQDLQLQARAAAIAALSPVALSLAAPQLELQDDQLRAAATSLVLQAGSENANANTDANPAALSLHGRLDTPIVADLAARSVQLDKLAAELTITAAQKLARPVRLTLQGSARADLQQQQAAARLAGRLDDSQLTGWLDATGFGSAGAATVRFGLDVDRFNVDDYLRTTSSSAGTPPSPGAAPALPPGLDLQGELNVGNLQAAGVKARNLHLVFATRDGRLHMLTAPH